MGCTTFAPILILSQALSLCLEELVVLEDNDAVIKMSMKGRTNRMRHVPRTHRIDLDWLFDVM